MQTLDVRLTTFPPVFCSTKFAEAHLTGELAAVLEEASF
jgi:hypothetical protein